MIFTDQAKGKFPFPALNPSLMGHPPPSRDSWRHRELIRAWKGNQHPKVPQTGEQLSLSFCSQARVWVKVKDGVWSLNSKFKCRRSSVRVLCFQEATGQCQTLQTPRSTGDPRLWHQLEEEQEPQPCSVQVRLFSGRTRPDWWIFWQFGQKNREAIRLKGPLVYESWNSIALDQV